MLDDPLRDSAGVSGTYHRSVIVLEVLGTQPFDVDRLDVGDDFSVVVLAETSTQVSAEHMAALLEMQGSDPGFLGI